MLAGAHNKVGELDEVIASAQRARDELKKQLSRAMGIGSGNKDKGKLKAERRSKRKRAER